MKKLSIAICTYNRSALLPYAFRSVCHQSCPREWIELLIIDNASTDDTEKVAKRLIDEEHIGKYYYEPKQGLSNAKNKAISVSSGDAIMFLDDDAELYPTYVDNLYEIFIEENELGVVGGPIELKWLCDVPEWYEPFCDQLFSQLYIASYRLDIHYPLSLYGSNMVFPIDIIKRVNGFNNDYGRRGKLLTASEDAEILLRIDRDNKKRIIWDPNLKIKHLMFKEKVTMEFLFGKVKGYSRTRAMMHKQYRDIGGPLQPLITLLNTYIQSLLGFKMSKLQKEIIRADCISYLKEWFQST